jgi:hypothetical protein
MTDNLKTIALLVFMTVTAFISGSLFGFNEGFDIGKYVGHLDTVYNFTHNGVKE